MLEKDESFKWGTFQPALSYHGNKMSGHTPFYITPNNLPSVTILEIRRRGLGLDIVVLMMAKFKNKNLSVSSRTEIASGVS